MNFPDVEGYKVLKYLGQGGYSKVYLVESARSHKLYACKIVDKNNKHIQNEIKNQFKVHKHKYVCGIYKHFEDDTSIYIILEYFESSLGKQLHDIKIVSEGQTCIIIKQILETVQYLHDNDIVHCDLKPGNILSFFSRKNRTYEYVICDFGLAEDISNGRRLKDKKGTPNYIAPEVANRELYDSKADVWSLGVIMYRMLLGVYPFHAESKDEIYKRVRIGKFTYPSNRNISDDAKEVINAMMTINQNDRLTIKEVLELDFFKCC